MSFDGATSIPPAPYDTAMDFNPNLAGYIDVLPGEGDNSLDASRSLLEEVSNQPAVSPEMVIVGAEHASGVSNVASQLGAGAWNELTVHYDRVIENGVVGGALGVATKIGLETAKKSTYGVLAAAGLYGVYQLGCALPGWKRSAAIAYNPLGYDISEVQKAEQHMQSLGGGAVDLIAGGAAGGAGFAYGGPLVAPAKSFFSATGRAMTNTRSAFFGSPTGSVAESNWIAGGLPRGAELNRGTISQVPWTRAKVDDTNRSLFGSRTAAADSSPDPLIGPTKAAPTESVIAERKGIQPKKIKEPSGFTGFFLSDEAKLQVRGPLAVDGESIPLRWTSPEESHVTFKFGAKESAGLPRAEKIEAVGYATDNTGVEALVVEVDGTMTRASDGKIYHITRSLAEGRKAKESMDVISKAMKAESLRKEGNPVPEELQNYAITWLRPEERFTVDFTAGFKASPQTPPKNSTTAIKPAVKAEPAVSGKVVETVPAEVVETAAGAEAVAANEAPSIGKVVRVRAKPEDDMVFGYDAANNVVRVEVGEGIVATIKHIDGQPVEVNYVYSKDGQITGTAKATTSDGSVWKVEGADGPLPDWKGTIDTEMFEWQRALEETKFRPNPFF